MTKQITQQTKLFTGTLLGTALLSSAAFAQSSAQAPMQEEATWMSIHGEVSEVDSKFITINTGDGDIIVDTTKLKLDTTAFEEIGKSKVSVTAKVSDDFLTDSRLQAESLYVQDINTAFVGKDASAQQAEAFVRNAHMGDSGKIALTGIVTGLSEDAFQFSTGQNSITVETDDLDDNPLDKDGYYQLSQGDKVKVTASFDDDLLEDYEIEADTLTRLQQAE